MGESPLPAVVPTVTLVQMTVPPYREAFLALLRERLPGLLVAAGNEFYDGTVRRRETGAADAPIDRNLQNTFLLRRRFAFQRGYRVAFMGSVAVVELNPRTLSTWLLLVEARLRQRPVIVWGHYLGRSLGATKPGIGRAMQVRLAGRVLAYTDHDAEKFRASFQRAIVHVAPNATESSVAIGLAASDGRTNFLYVGRLVADKRVDLLVEGFSEAVRRGAIPLSARLVIAGGGPERAGLEVLAASGPAGDRIDFVGETYEPDILNILYSKALAGVCGGYVGLNLTQSLSRGTPFVYPAESPHSPEIAMAIPGVNTVAFAPSARWV